MSPKEEARRSRLRDWRLWVAAIYVAWVLFGFLAVPRIVTWQVAEQSRERLGRETSIQEARFNPFTLALTLRGIECRDPDGETFVAVDEAVLNASVMGLLRWAAIADEIRVVGPRVRVRMLADERLSFQDLIDRLPDDGADDGPPRFAVAELEVLGGVFEFRDLTRTPVYRLELDDLSLALSHVSTLDQDEGAHEVTVHLGRSTQLRWSGSLVSQPLVLDGRFELSGLALPGIWDYLGSAYAFEMPDGNVDASIAYRIERSPEKTISARFTNGTGVLSGLTLREDATSETMLDVASARLEGLSAAWPERTVDVESIVVETVNVDAYFDEEGTINWKRLVQRSEATGEEPAVEPADAPGDSSPSIRVSVGSVEVRGVSAHLADRRKDPPAEASLSNATAKIIGFSYPEDAPAKVELDATVGEAGSARATGTVSVVSRSAALEVAASDISIVEHLAWIPRLGLGEIVSGRAGMQGSVKLTLEGSLEGGFEGEAGLDDFEMLGGDGQRLLAVENLDATGIGASLRPIEARVKSVVLTRPFAKIRIDSNGVLNLQKQTIATVDAGAKKVEPAAQVPFSIDVIDVENGEVDFADLSLIIPFAAEVMGGNGSVRDLSSTSQAPSLVEIEGSVGESGYAKVEGTLKPFEPFAATELRVVFRNIDMATLTPYSAEFAGYAIEGGRLDVDVLYTIRNRRLKGEHNVLAQDLVLGDRVEGGGKIPVPLKLGVALLRDKDGRIDMNVPMEGPIDDPDFNYRQLAWSALKQIIVNVASKPFNFIGDLLGISGDELERVAFEAGDARILPPEAEQIRKLLPELTARREIRVEVVPVLDPLSDADAIRADKLAASIEAKKAEIGGDVTTDRVLEKLFEETRGADALAAARERHSKTGEDGEVALDGAGFYAELRASLRAAQTVDAFELEALAVKRGEALVSALTGEGGIEPARVSLSQTQQVPEKDAGSELVASRLTLSVN